jgi:hypothetical protein
VIDAETVHNAVDEVTLISPFDEPTVHPGPEAEYVMVPSPSPAVGVAVTCCIAP